MEKTYKIMVVDDDRELVEAVQVLLEARRYAVVPAYSGQECLRKVKEENPDLIVLDIMMVDVSEGFNVVQTLRSKAPDSEYASFSEVPIILLTGVQQKMKLKFSDMAGTESLPVQDFIEKPVAPKELLARIERVLKEGESQKGE